MAKPLKPGTEAQCRFCQQEFTVGEKNVATPQPGDFVQLCRDYNDNSGLCLCMVFVIFVS